MEVKVSKEEILHIANLASLNIKEEEIEKYRENLQEILQFAEVVNQVNVEELAETIGEENKFNAFRKDEIKDFENKEGIMANAPEKVQNMFKVPKVVG